jgi:hypothetical protein
MEIARLFSGRHSRHSLRYVTTVTRGPWCILNAMPETQPHPRFAVRIPGPLWIGLAAVTAIAVAIGLRLGVPIYRHNIAIRELDRVAYVVTAPVGYDWLRRWVDPKRMRGIDEVTEIRGRFGDLQMTLRCTWRICQDCGLFHLIPRRSVTPGWFISRAFWACAICRWGIQR